MKKPDPLKFFDDEVRCRWIENALIHPRGPIKIILVCYDDLDAAYYPVNLMDGNHYVDKIHKIELQNSTVTVIEIIDVENNIVYRLV